MIELESVPSILLPIRNEGFWGYCDETGHEVISPKYESTGWSFEGTPYGVSGNRIELLDPLGNTTGVVEKAWAMESFSRGLLRFERDDSFGYCDSNGNELISPRYDRAQCFDSFGGSVCEVRDGIPHWRRIDRGGRNSSNSHYSMIRPFRGSIAGAQRHADGQYIFIDGAGNAVIDDSFLDIRSLSNGLIPVRFVRGSQGMGWVNERFEVVVGPSFDELGDYFSQGLIPAKKNGKWGLVSKNAKWVCEPIYHYVGNGEDGLWPFAVESQPKDGSSDSEPSVLFGYLDSQGVEFVPADYVRARGFRSGIGQVHFARDVVHGQRSLLCFGYINLSGQIIWQERSNRS